MSLESDEAPVEESIVDRLRRWATERPHTVAYTFLDGGLEVVSSLTFGELWLRATRFAAGLRRLGGDEPRRVALIFEAGDGFIVSFFGALAAGMTVVPLPTPFRRGAELWTALDPIFADCAPVNIVLGTELGWAREVAGERSTLLLNEVLAAGDEAGPAKHRVLDGSHLAILQYTSGSTGSPKGVMITHANVMANSQRIYESFEVTDQTRSLTWLPHYHDMGLIGGLVQPTYGGFSVFVCSPLTFAVRPLRWLQAIAKYRCTVSGAPNFAYDSVLRRLPSPAIEELDLSSWRLAFVGAEPVSAETLEAFARALEPNGFRRSAIFPCYGMAEATLIATGGFIPRANAWTAAPNDMDPWARLQAYPGCGAPVPDHDLSVVDPIGRVRVEDGVVGEAWLRGPSVARGYWQRQEATQASFDQIVEGEGGYFRTGDLGFLRDGQWHPTGRLKEIIIVRGKNYPAADVEAVALRAHPQVAPGGAAAFGSLEADGERFILLVELQRGAERLCAPAEIEECIREAILQAFGVAPDQIVLLALRTLQRTTSGKIARQACRRAWNTGELGRGLAVSDSADAKDELIV